MDPQVEFGGMGDEDTDPPENDDIPSGASPSRGTKNRARNDFEDGLIETHINKKTTTNI